MLLLLLPPRPRAAADSTSHSEQEYEDEIVNPIRTLASPKADFKVVDQLIPDLTTLMFKELAMVKKRN